MEYLKDVYPAANSKMIFDLITIASLSISEYTYAYQLDIITHIKIFINNRVFLVQKSVL